MPPADQPHRPPDSAPAAAPAAPQAGGAARVALGILASRLAGFARQRAVAHFFGISPYADVFAAALRAPNLLQNLLGEGTLSASFIPVYSRMLARGEEREAGRFAGAALGLLIVVVALAVLAGMLLAGPLVALLTPGFLKDAVEVAEGARQVDRYALAVTAVRIVFPMTGILVLSAWALGVLNSHRRFLLSYLAPVLWNLAIIGALILVARGGGGVLSALPAMGGAGGVGAGGVAAGGVTAGVTPGLERLLFAACYGALLGALLQLAVQLPTVARLLTGFRLSLSTRVAGVRRALAALGPVIAGRGVVQLAGYLDLVLASLLAAGALAAMQAAQFLYLLPVSLFGMSVAAAELPELSRSGGLGEAAGEGGVASGEAAERFIGRVNAGLRQTAFLTLPTAAGYLIFGLPLVMAVFRTGRFGAEDSWLVWLVLAGYSLGLVASTASRLLQNAFFALGDTRTPAWIAVQRVSAAAVVAVPAMLLLDRLTVVQLAAGWHEGLLAGVPPVGDAAADWSGRLRIGAVGLALGSAVGAWLELARLAITLRRRMPLLTLPWRPWGSFSGLALVAMLPAAALWRWLLPGGLHPLLTGAAVVGLYAACYLALAAARRRPELSAWTAALRRRR